MTNEQIEAEALRIAGSVSLPLADGIALMRAISMFGWKIADAMAPPPPVVKVRKKQSTAHWTPEARAASAERMRAQQPLLVAARRAKRAQACGGGE